MDPIVTVRNLTFNYGSFVVLSGVTFEVEKGDYVALAGPNGAGKTTLIKTLLALGGNYEGEIKLFGKDLARFNEWGKIGYLPQNTGAYNPLFPATVEEIIGLGLLSSKRFPKKFSSRDRAKIIEALERIDAAGLQKKPVGELSGGEQQRVFLARALVASPELLILDEPSTALDPQTRELFFTSMQEMNKEDQLTIILITHDTANIGRFASKLLYLDKKVIFWGKFSEFCASPNMEDYFGHFLQHLICHQHD